MKMDYLGSLSKVSEFLLCIFDFAISIVCMFAQTRILCAMTLINCQQQCNVNCDAKFLSVGLFYILRFFWTRNEAKEKEFLGISTTIGALTNRHRCARLCT